MWSCIAKLEALNPGGSVKDRIGVAMIEAAEAEGRIEPGRTTIVEATSGNTGIALAFVCAAKGYDLVLTLPQGMSRERESLLRLYGARVDITESMGGMGEAVEAARGDGARRRRVPARPVLEPRQPGRPPAHDGPGDRRALDGRVDVLVAGVGTGGTITGVGEYLRERNPDLRIVAVEPRGSAVLSGGHARSAPHPGHRRGLRAGGAQPRAARRGDRGLRRGRDPYRLEPAPGALGLLAGISCGAALWAALQVAARPESKGKRIVVIMPDSGERYVSQAVLRSLSPSARDWPLRCCHAWLSAHSRGSRKSCVAMWRPRATAIPRREVSRPARFSPPGPGSTRCWPTASRTRCTVPGCRLLPRTISMLTRALTGIEIHPAARIGEGLFIDHGAGVVIGETADIGDDVTLYQGVTLGGTGFATGKRHPTVQDNVTIGSGAKLLGPITIGHGAKIGANSVVITDVPPNSTVVGNPGHPVRVDGRRVEGPDADWIHLPDPIAEAIQGLASRIGSLERTVAELSGEEPDAPAAEVQPLHTVKGPNPAGG